ncbi:nitrilase, partial [bacterium]|nr:nitrilase [bacterium]
MPELWATGFVYPQLAELSRQTPWILEQLSELAALHNLVIAGTLVERVEDERRPLLYNTLFFSDGNGLAG